MWNAQAALDTLAFLCTLKAERFVPSHTSVTDDIRPLAEVNANAIHAVLDKILELCTNPLTFEELLQQIFEAYSMTMTAQQYALIGSTIRSYLSGLHQQGKISFQIENNRMVWKTL